MFYSLTGVLAHSSFNFAVIDVNGVGYACHTSQNTLGRLKSGETAKLYTYLNVREDIMELYGFSTLEELSTFKMLIGISGIGPKVAISLLSVTTPESLALSIITGDEKTLTQAPGVGKKVAQRLILELKDKLAKSGFTSSSSGSDSSFMPAMGGGKQSEVIGALGVLGYTSAEAALALKGLDAENMTVEELIRATLQKLARL